MYSSLGLLYLFISMDYVEFDGTRYVKATELARELGYTADYVGQLCRAEKVDARLVGRSWYVEPESLRAHRSEKKRSTKELDRREMHSQQAQNEPARSAENTFIALGARYEPDTSELIPQPKKRAVTDFTPTSIGVSAADAQSVDITSDNTAYEVSNERPAEPPLQGKVTVRLMDDDEPAPTKEERPAVDSSEQAKPVAESTADAAAPPEATPSTNQIQKVRPRSKVGDMGGPTARSSEEVVTHTTTATAPNAVPQARKHKTRYAVGAVGVAVCIAVVLVGLSGVVHYDATAPADEMLSASIMFDRDALLETIQLAK